MPLVTSPRFARRHVRRTNPLLSGLVAQWSLEEDGGTRRSHNGLNDLTNNNGVTRQDGRVGMAAEFTPASSQFLSLSDTPDLSFDNQDFCVAAWVNLRSTVTDRDIVTKRKDATVGEFRLVYRASPINRFEFNIKPGQSAAVRAEALGTPTLNTWYALFAWLDTKEQTTNLQVDGGSVDSVGTAGLVTTDSTSLFVIGAANDGTGAFWDGLIDEISIWKDRILTRDERAYLYHDGLGRPFPWDR